MKNLTPMLLTDFYKISHRVQYPIGTQRIYSTWTPRASRKDGINKVVAFGFQAFIKEYLVEYFDENFFNRDKQELVEEYKNFIEKTLGEKDTDTSHIEELHDLGYLPIQIKALPEGTRCNIRVPMLTIENTDDRFFWITNFLETLMSCQLWQPSTSATIALQYKELLDEFAKTTNGDLSSVAFQGHDFSMRGMGSLESAKLSGAGHLLSFVGTDSIPSIDYLERYYNCSINEELVGTSIPATEHSVMCTYGRGEEFETYKRLITEVYPSGFASIVSDTWDLWKVLEDIVKPLKDVIMNRDGRVVIRPDSGNPVDILCGTVNVIDFEDCDTFESCKGLMLEYLEDSVRYNTPHGECGNPVAIGYFRYNGDIYKICIDISWNRYDKQYYYIDESEIVSCEKYELSPSEKGVIEILWDIFGGTITEKGYRQLDTHIGCIYGDAITYERCKEICNRLMNKGFASTNAVFGIGSFTYQYNTRDTFGFALKSTYAKVNEEERKLFKDPITDDGTKKSQRGRVVVVDGKLIDGLNFEEESSYENNQLETIFLNGKLVKEYSLKEIRERLRG